MSISKIHIEKNTVQETLVIPLYGRKMCTEQFPDLFQNPNAAVVNLGCGLDQTAENQDNGTCRIYNIDMPDIIEVREQVIKGSDTKAFYSNAKVFPGWKAGI